MLWKTPWKTPLMECLKRLSIKTPDPVDLDLYSLQLY